MTVAVVRFPGSNCDMDTCFVLESVVSARVRLVWHRDSLGEVDAVVLPGGFSYGDYLRSGALAAQSPVMQEVKRFAARGGPVLGICNGFQVLTETGLLPGQLARNPHLHFSCQTVHLRVEKSVQPFTSRYGQGDVLQIPIAHNEGRYYASQQVLEALEDNGQILFRYCGRRGELSDAANPNGSLNHIAGITNKAGNVLGMMPHPERASESLLGSSDGLPLFESLLDAITTAAAR